MALRAHSLSQQRHPHLSLWPSMLLSQLPIGWALAVVNHGGLGKVNHSGLDADER